MIVELGPDDVKGCEKTLLYGLVDDLLKEQITQCSGIPSIASSTRSISIMPGGAGSDSRLG
jgi:hypothetical protein